MLILGRKPGQKILVKKENETVMEIFVSSIQGNQVRLGFESPKEYNIIREELDKSSPRGGK